MTTHAVQAFNQQPLQSSLEHHMGLEYGALTPWQEAITKWTHSSGATQKAPVIQALPTAHQLRPFGVNEF